MIGHRNAHVVLSQPYVRPGLPEDGEPRPFERADNVPTNPWVVSRGGKDGIVLEVKANTAGKLGWLEVNLDSHRGYWFPDRSTARLA